MNYRVGITVTTPALRQTLAPMWGRQDDEATEAVMNGVATLLEPFDEGLLRVCTDYGTDGKSLDLGWYCFTAPEARALKTAARTVAEAQGWTVVEAEWHEVKDD